MTNGYRELNALPAAAFLQPEEFRTFFDALEVNVARRGEQYQEGLKIGQESRYVSISASTTWNAKGKDGSHTFSYEGIGYHANTADLLRGFLDSGVPIVVHRCIEGEPLSSTWIQGEPQSCE